MSDTSFYARITPTNAIVGEKFSISITGVTAGIDAQKTWSGGSLNFKIIPTSTGAAVVTFKNDTLNKIIGTKSINIAALSSNGKATIKIGKRIYPDSGGSVVDVGYAATSGFGELIYDTLTIQGTPLGLTIFSYLVVQGDYSNAALFITVSNTQALTKLYAGTVYFKCTNTRTGATFTTGPCIATTVGVGDGGLGYKPQAPATTNIPTNMFTTIGDLIDIELIYVQ